MAMASESKPVKRKVHERPTLEKIVLLPLFFLIVLWNRTLRIRFEGAGGEAFVKGDQPYLLISWHNTLFVSPLLIRRLRKQRKICALVSASKDGAWLTAMFELIGFRSVRGSANFRGGPALKELIRATRQGWDIGITPDGSRGPAYVVKPGAAAVAKVCQAGLILVGMQFHNAWRVRSWDRFFIPKPFSKVTVRVQHIASFEDLNEPDVNRASQVIQQRLLALHPQDSLIPTPSTSVKPEAAKV